MTDQPPLIFVVDDDPDFLDLNQRMLKRAGYRTVCFATSDMAIAAMKDHTPDLIITDLMMENLDSGFSFSRAVRQEPRLSKVPIIVVTAMTSQRGFDFRPRNDDDLAAMQVDAFLEKPLDYARLIERIKQILSRNRENVP